jgi:hypothetical protein
MSDDPNQKTTLNAHLDSQGHLPGAEEADELVERLLKSIYEEDEPGHTFTDVALTYRPARDSDYTDAARRSSADGRQYGRVKPEIGFQEYWHPIGAPLPVVCFKMTEASGHSEWWSETVHPRLVASGQNEVMKHLARFLYYEIRDVTSQLTKLLQWLSVARKQDALDATWPVRMSEEPGQEWDADPEDPVPDVEGEPTVPTAGDLFDI